MKTKIILAAMVVVMMTTGFECINDPIIISLDATPLSGCVTINPGNGIFNSSTGSINIKNLIPADYRDKFKGIRVYNILVQVDHPHPTGRVSGSIFVRFDSQPELKLLDYNGEYETISQGVSLINSNGVITYNPLGLAAVVSALANPSSLPTNAVLRAQSTSGPAITQPLKLCMTVYLQVDADAK